MSKASRNKKNVDVPSRKQKYDSYHNCKRDVKYQ